MTALDVLTEGFERVRDGVREAAADLAPGQLEARPDEDANSIGWLLWHTSRVQDAQMAALAGSDEVWLADGWVDRFGLALDREDTGFGHDHDQVAAVRGISAEQLTAYQDATFERTRQILADLTDADLGRVIDESYDPPVTVGVRVLSILADDLEHVGQAAYVRGIVERG